MADSKSLGEMSLSQLEQRVEAIDEELDKLSKCSMRGSMGPLGWRSHSHHDPYQNEWVRVDLGRRVLIDQVALVPTIWRDSNFGLMSDGFPEEFKIIVGNDNDPQGRVVASFTAEDKLLPRIEPLVVNFPETSVSWVRFQATKLAPRAWDGYYQLQLSELMVFSGEENVALRKPIRVSSQEPFTLRARVKETMVDGSLPYLMDAAGGVDSKSFVSVVDDGSQPSLTIDLGKQSLVSQVHLHTVDLSDNIPEVIHPTFGIPEHFIVEGANSADFSDAVQLCEYRVETVFDADPIIMLNFEEREMRYIRVTALRPHIDAFGSRVRSVVGFSEIVVLSKGINLAKGLDVDLNFEVRGYVRPLENLTDGKNFYGEILPIRTWINQLARRHDLENERPLVVQEAAKRYAIQERNLRRMYWLAALLVVAIGFVVLVGRIVRMQHVNEIRERFAADLHDELGADIHCIGLLSDLAQDAREEPEKLEGVLRNIREATEETGNAVRHYSNLQEGRLSNGGVRGDIERIAERVVVHLTHNIKVEGEEFLEQLKPRTCSDLLLFYKECLINICRHSGATSLSTHLTADAKSIQLRVEDNGMGIASMDENGVPQSLKRRARLMGARVTISSLAGRGTCIRLTVRNHMRWFYKLLGIFHSKK
ncbi:histidine kinase [Rubritalea spongiae]|uniref:histidine kinase n=1 Tax=Rubritalea spongiae TaxID=430797 RepID=UPI0036218516